MPKGQYPGNRKPLIRIRQDTENIRALYREGKTSYEIAEIYGCSRSTITNWLKRNGEALRPSHKRKGIAPWNKGKRYEAIRGERNPNWKGGVTPLTQQIRHSLEYKRWIKAVMERDNFTCRWCGQRGGAKEANHIIPFRDCRTNPTLLFSPSNGITLCIPCHQKTKYKEYEFVSLFQGILGNKA